MAEIMSLTQCGAALGTRAASHLCCCSSSPATSTSSRQTPVLVRIKRGHLPGFGAQLKPPSLASKRRPADLAKQGEMGNTHYRTTTKSAITPPNGRIAPPPYTTPKTMAEALETFWTHPTAKGIAVAGAVLLALRLVTAPVSVDDVAAAGVVGLWWALQEWLVHKYLLHSSFEWFGKDIHTRHHAYPYFHVSLDGPDVVIPTMGVAACVFLAIFAPFHHMELAATATVTYWFMGLLYEWTHYICHTQVPLSSEWARGVRKNHMLHHCRNEDYWLSFTLPAIDVLLGTGPSDASKVPMSDLARRLAAFDSSRRSVANAGAEKNVTDRSNAE